MPVSPIMGSGSSCGARTLPHTSSHYLVGPAACISTSTKDLGVDLFPAIWSGQIEHTEMSRPAGPATDTQGDVCEKRSSLGVLVGRARPGIGASS